MVSLRSVLVVLVAVAVGAYFALLPRLPVPEASKSAVFITGCSTGIGRHAALFLAAQGYLVFAGVRKPSDAAALVDSAAADGVSSQLVPVLVDVAVEGDAVKAAAEVSALLSSRYPSRKLAVLVNNAGVAQLGAVENVPMDSAGLFDVNVFGLMSTTSAFLPLLRDHGLGARIVNVGSVAGLVSMPMYSTYAASKFAVEALSDGLRAELFEFGIGVTVLEPGGIVTPIGDKIQASAPVDVTDSKLPPAIAEAYASKLRAFLKTLPIAIAYLPGPDVTSAAILNCLTAASPPARTTVGYDAFLMKWLSRMLPTPILDFLLLGMLKE